MKTHLDLFSGIGGFALAAHWAGYTTVGFCEYEDYPRRVLARHWPGVQCHGDIRHLDGTAYHGVTLITGGFPCQPFSSAGDQKGSADDRFLWPEMLRVIKQAQPGWVVAENVAGLINLELDQVLANLEGEGYACGTVVLPACAVDAPHRRDRVWIIGRNTKLPGDVADSGSGRCLQPEGRKMEQSRGTETERASEAMANSDCFGMEGERTEQQAARSSRTGEDVADTNSIGFNDSLERQEKVQQFNSENQPGKNGPYWLPEPDVGRVAHGIPNRVDRIKGLGNAIVPQVAYEIIKQLN